MRLPGNWRPQAERILRVASIAALVALAVRLWSGSGAAGSTVVVSTGSLDSALVAWSASSPAHATVEAAVIPGGRQRDWLVALRRTGLAVDWTTSDSSGGALVVEAGPLPTSPSRVTASGSPGRGLLLADELGPIDSTRAGPDGIAVWRAKPLGTANLTLGASSATAAARDSLVTKPLLVLGQAGWESRFVTAALEEDGWPVTARLAVAPGAIVRQGPPVRIDTASLSAVIVLDSTSAIDAREIARFVSEGGGVVASGAGTNHPALRTLLPSRVSAVSTGAVGALLGPSPRAGLSTRTFAGRADAVALERRGDAPVVLGRRVGSGRVIATGYDDTWRIRMAPPDDNAPEVHRRWWSSLAAGVVHSRLVPRDAGPVDEAPFAATVDALGPPSGPGEPADSEPRPWDAWLAALAAATLLAEWLSRRLRGVA
jgi:hypothetical protein